MITKEQLRFIFWPWGEVKILREKLSQLSAGIEACKRDSNIRIEQLKTSLSTSQKLSPNLFQRIEDLRQQLLVSEQENERLQAENRQLRQRLNLPRGNKELPPLTDDSV